MRPPLDAAGRIESARAARTAAAEALGGLQSRRVAVAEQLRLAAAEVQAASANLAEHGDDAAQARFDKATASREDLRTRLDGFDREVLPRATQKLDVAVLAERDLERAEKYASVRDERDRFVAKFHDEYASACERLVALRREAEAISSKVDLVNGQLPTAAAPLAYPEDLARDGARASEEMIDRERAERWVYASTLQLVDEGMRVNESGGGKGSIAVPGYSPGSTEVLRRPFHLERYLPAKSAAFGARLRDLNLPPARTGEPPFLVAGDAIPPVAAPGASAERTILTRLIPAFNVAEELGQAILPSSPRLATKTGAIGRRL